MAGFLKAIVDTIRRRYVYRSSVTGRFVTKAFAETNPATTYRVRAK